MNNKIFISHSQMDKTYAEAIVNLLLGIGVKEDDIICTSVPGFGIPLNMDIYDYLRDVFNNYSLHVLFVLSNNYYNSTASQNEMGAAWVLNKTYTSFLVPGFKFSAVKGAVNPNKLSISLDDDMGVICDLLNQFRNIIQRTFLLNGISETRWERLRSCFINDVT